MTMRAIIVLLCLAASCAWAEQIRDPDRLPPALSELRQRLSSAEVIEGALVQEKSLAGVDHAIRFDGEFLFLRDVGFLWRFEPPIGVTYLFRDGRFFRKADDAVKFTEVSMAPGAVPVQGDLFTALLTLDVAELLDGFELQVEARDAGLHVVLVPRARTVRSVLRRIEIEVSEQVDALSFQNANGDRTELHLRDVSVRSRAEAADRNRLEIDQ